MQEDRPVRLEKELKNLSYQVRKIGVNINQVVAKINAGYGNQIDIYNLEKALEQVKHEMKTLNEKVEDYGNHYAIKYWNAKGRRGCTFKKLYFLHHEPR